MSKEYDKYLNTCMNAWIELKKSDAYKDYELKCYAAWDKLHIKEIEDE